MPEAQDTKINLATIETDDAGTVTIALEYRDNTRVLVGRTPDGATHEISDQPAEGYGDGYPGIIGAMGDLQVWYRDIVWGLVELVDWRDYLSAAVTGWDA